MIFHVQVVGWANSGLAVRVRSRLESISFCLYDFFYLSVALIHKHYFDVIFHEIHREMLKISFFHIFTSEFRDFC